MESIPRKIIWGSLAASGVLAVAAAWLLLELRARAGETERLKSELTRARREPPPPVPPEPVARPSAVKPAADAIPPEDPKQAGDVVRAAASALDPLSSPEPEEIPGLKARVLDLSADPKDRLAALARLRLATPDGRSPEVVRSMIDLLRVSPDGEVRADVCRQLSRVVSEDLKQQLLLTARADSFAKAREEATETLGRMKDDPVVRQALESILASDPDEDVKTQARKSLSGRR